MTVLWMTRARLRQDASLAALAPVLLPTEPGPRIGMAHRLVWTLFGDQPDRRRDFLWREDRPGQFIILSARKPDEGLLFTLETKPFAPRLEAGDHLRFMLRVNPTITHAVPDRAQPGKRDDVVMNALNSVPKEDRACKRKVLIQSTAAGWLACRAERAGFAVLALQADGYDQIRILRDESGTRARFGPIRFSVLDLEGVLEVNDPALFLTSLASGFGRAKAFGCGLMLIRRTT
jgi:CRISPR system Cascade subunit CasE